MKTSTITFHSAYNYGSMLQAFALQKTIQSIGFENDIINFRTDRQREMYNYKTCTGSLIKKIIYKLLSIPFRNALKKKSFLFEKFLKEELQLTKEYKTFESLLKADLQYDCYITGSDQVWNTSAFDFDNSYFLSFVKNKKKIAYAVSVGPNVSSICIDSNIKKAISSFSHISVREIETQHIIENLINKNISLVLDPTLLLTAADWIKYNKVQNSIPDGDYILLYTPYLRAEVLESAAKIGQTHGLKIINTVFFPRQPMHKGIINQFETGPWEFLKLLQYCKCVISGSYHAIVFSMIFHKPFISIGGDNDSRIKTLLEKTCLLDREVRLEDVYKISMDYLITCDFSKADSFFHSERKKSIDFLINSIKN